MKCLQETSRAIRSGKLALIEGGTQVQAHESFALAEHEEHHVAIGTNAERVPRQVGYAFAQQPAIQMRCGRLLEWNACLLLLLLLLLLCLLVGGKRLQPYADQRRERMRRMRFTASLVAALSSQFGPEARERRRRFYERPQDGSDPELKFALAAASMGPHNVPSFAFEESMRARVLR